MRSRLLRRSATAAGYYGGVLLGVAGTVVAARILEPNAFGRFALVVSAASFFQTLLDLTVEEAVVKFGFRYTEREAWGRLRRLLSRALALKLVGGLLAAVCLVVLAPLAKHVFDAGGLAAPLYVAALLPVAQAPENVGGSVLILRGRYDVRAWFVALGMALRLAALAVAAPHGVTWAVAALVVAQALSTLAIGGAGALAFRRFPVARAEPLAEDRPEITRFVAQSSIATGVVVFRPAITPVLLGVVSTPVQVGYFRVAQAPQSGLAAASAPARIILLTEHTRDWERGARAEVLAGVRRYMLGAGALMAAVVPLAWWLMPDLVRIVFGSDYRGAVDAARIMLLAAALQFTFGWTKSFPVSIGRPNLRILAHGVETLVLLPLLVVLGARYDAAGAAGAVLAAMAAFCAVWLVLLGRITGETLRGAAEAPAG